mmetsp:Transcript_11523/g.20440  ORF Transcript_11523/g.20440 Transcript_11523/m.20440 type:complete len:241 (-) Transcript_11523:26-748(-)
MSTIRAVGECHGCRRTRQVHAQLPHLHCTLKEVVITFSLSLGMDPVLAPNVDTVAAYQHSVGLGIGNNCCPQPVREFTFPGCVLNDGHHKISIEAMALNALDHLTVCHPELVGIGVQEGGKKGVHAVAVDNSPCATKLIRSHEQGKTLAELGWPCWCRLRQRRVQHFASGIEHEHFIRLHPLFLHSRRRHHDVLAHFDGDATTCAADSPLIVQILAQVADQHFGILHLLWERHLESAALG